MFSGQKDIQASSNWKQVRNRSETGQKHQKGSTCLASHPSIHPSTSALIIATNTTTTAPATTTTTATTTATTATTTTPTTTPTPTSTPTPTPNATSLSLSLAYSLTLLPELLRLLLFQFPLPLLLVLLLLLVHCEFSGPFPDRTSLFCSQIWNRMRSRMDPHYIIHNLYFMYMIWSTKNKPFRDCSLWYRGCYAIGWAIEGCPGKGILDNPHIYIITNDYKCIVYIYNYIYIYCIHVCVLSY